MWVRVMHTQFSETPDVLYSLALAYLDERRKGGGADFREADHRLLDIYWRGSMPMAIL